MSFKVIKSKAEGPKDEPVILSSEVIDSNSDFVDASDAMYYEVLGFKKAGCQAVETKEGWSRRAVIVDGSDRVQYVIDLIEE